MTDSKSGTGPGSEPVGTAMHPARPASEFEAEARALARAVVRAAEAAHATLVTAESCTGGLVAHLLTEIPGASRVFHGGWVLYDNRRKVADLALSPALLSTHGAVSRPVAEALAENARRRAAAQHAVATTGIAGPTGATAEKPAGFVWIAVASEGGNVRAEAHQHAGDRSANKMAFAADALRALLGVMSP